MAHIFKFGLFSDNIFYLWILCEIDIVHILQGFIFVWFTSDHEYEVLRKDPLSLEKHQPAKKDGGVIYEEPVAPRPNIPQVYHQVKWPSQKGIKQCKQQPPHYLYDEINEKANLHIKPHVVGFII